MKEKEKTQNREAGQSVFTKETLCISLIVFSTLVLFILFTRDLVFGDVGNVVSSFVLGVFGFTAYPVFVYAIVRSMLALTGKFPLKASVEAFVILDLVCLALIAHTATVASMDLTEQDLAGHLSACFTAAEESSLAATGFGVIGGLITFHALKAMSAVGVYVVSAILLVAFSVALYHTAKTGVLRATAKEENDGVVNEKREERPVDDEPVNVRIRGARNYPVEGVNFDGIRQQLGGSAQRNGNQNNGAPVRPFAQGNNGYPDPRVTGEAAQGRPAVPPVGANVGNGYGNPYANGAYANNGNYGDQGGYMPGYANAYGNAAQLSVDPHAYGVEVPERTQSNVVAEQGQRAQTNETREEVKPSNVMERESSEASEPIDPLNLDREEKRRILFADRPLSGNFTANLAYDKKSVYNTSKVEADRERLRYGTNSRSSAATDDISVQPTASSYTQTYQTETDEEVGSSVSRELYTEGNTIDPDRARSMLFDESKRKPTDYFVADRLASRDRGSHLNVDASRDREIRSQEKERISDRYEGLGDSLEVEHVDEATERTGFDRMDRRAGELSSERMDAETVSDYEETSAERERMRDIVMNRNGEFVREDRYDRGAVDGIQSDTSAREEETTRLSSRDSVAGQQTAYIRENERDYGDRRSESAYDEDYEDDSLRGERLGREDRSTERVQTYAARDTRGQREELHVSEAYDDRNSVSNKDSFLDFSDDEEEYFDQADDDYEESYEDAKRETVTPSAAERYRNGYANTGYTQDQLGNEPTNASSARGMGMYGNNDFAVHKEYVRPPLSLFKNYPMTTENDRIEQEDNKRIIEETLGALIKVKAEVSSIVAGPTFTRYEVKLPTHVSNKRVNSYATDIAMALHAKDGVNIFPNLENGTNSIEVPNKTKSIVGLKPLLEDPDFRRASVSSLTFAIGKDVEGRNNYGRIAKMTHLLVAGATGAGKSCFLNSLILSLIVQYTPEEVRLILIDPKQIEFNVYKNLPHLMMNEIVSDPVKAIAILNWSVEEMERRYMLFNQMGDTGVLVRDIDEYNRNIKDGEKLPKIVIIIDELADLMMQSKKSIEDLISRLAAKARAAGVHLVLATQRPSVDVITGVVKNNLPTRFAFKVTADVDSRTILDAQGAEKLLGYGDLLYKTSSMFSPVRVQGCFVDSEEVQAVVDYIRKYNESYYDPTIAEIINRKIEEGEEPDEGERPVSEGNGNNVFIDALRMVVQVGSASISMIQRKFPVGYGKAGRIIDWMEKKGYITPYDGAKTRKVMLTQAEFDQLYNSGNITFDD